ALAGLWRLDGRQDADSLCSQMLSAQAMYGTHGVAQWTASDIALGRRLMKVLPEDAFDRQPLQDISGRFTLIADIRLDNRDELIGGLGISGDAASRLSDAAILMKAIERWEDRCVDHLIGDYAFVLWDARDRRLILSRDPIGQRPLFFHRGKDFFA